MLVTTYNSHILRIAGTILFITQTRIPPPPGLGDADWGWLNISARRIELTREARRLGEEGFEMVVKGMVKQSDEQWKRSESVGLTPLRNPFPPLLPLSLSPSFDPG